MPIARLFDSRTKRSTKYLRLGLGLGLGLLGLGLGLGLGVGRANPKPNPTLDLVGVLAEGLVEEDL